MEEENLTMSKKAGEILQQYMQELEMRIESAPKEEQRIKQELDEIEERKRELKRRMRGYK